MGENRKSAVAARQSARARVAEKMAERKQREKKIADKLESFFAADQLVSDAETARDDAITKANQVFEAVTSRADESKAGHVRSLKELDLTDREIADLIDQPVSTVRDLLKAAKPETPDESSTETPDESSTETSSPAAAETDGAAETALAS